VLILARGRLGFGLGVTQQHQTAHGRISRFGIGLNKSTGSCPGQGDKRRGGRLENAMTETSTSPGAGQGETLPFRSRLSFDLDVDICVVGAGLAGLTVAREAARLGASVAVLEGRHVGWNASGHQLGTVMPGFSQAIGDLIERVGLEDARELWAMSKEGADYVRAAATEEAMPGIALTEGALEVSNVDAGETLISRLQT